MAEGGHPYGADLTTRQFAQLIVALCTGTLIEWFDFTIYSQLSHVITEIFFPATNPAAASISYWAVFALGFISRPLGSIIFGHIGDGRGRRTTLLLSILCVSVPTILIGCLPTYKHIGIAAPILMALLRFIQGLAVGGEFGSAIVYLFETAPHHRKGTVASLGQAAISPGIIMGLISVLVVIYACTEDQLKLWGWRLPFLLTAFFAPVALILRMHMPEPHEYLISKQNMVLDRIASIAATHAAASYTQQHVVSPPGSRAVSKTLSSSINNRLKSRQLSLRLKSLTEVVTVDQDADPGAGAVPGAAADVQNGTRNADSGGKVERSVSLTRCTSGAGAAAAATSPGSLRQGSELKLHVPSVTPPAQGFDSNAAAHHDQAEQQQQLDLAVLACEEGYASEVQHLSEVIKHHVPLVVLFRGYWKNVLLLTLMEASYGSTFYVFFSWVPPYLQKATHATVASTLWPVLLGMALFPVVVVSTGRFICDRPVRKIYTLMFVILVLLVTSFPILLWLNTGHVVAQWLMMPIVLGISGGCGGMLASIGPQLFPPAVRASGYNLAHNLAMSVFGGLAPLAIGAVSVEVKPPAMAAGVVLVMTAVISWVAAVPLVKLAPHVNAKEPVGGF